MILSDQLGCIVLVFVSIIILSYWYMEDLSSYLHKIHGQVVESFNELGKVIMYESLWSKDRSSLSTSRWMGEIFHALLSRMSNLKGEDLCILPRKISFTAPVETHWKTKTFQRPSGHFRRGLPHI